VLRVMREAPISGRYGLIDLLAYIIYEICHTNTPTSAVQFGRVMQQATSGSDGCHAHCAQSWERVRGDRARRVTSCQMHGYE
jgi:hypothetical protein